MFKALTNLHVPGHKTIKKHTVFDPEKKGLEKEQIDKLKEAKLIEEVKEGVNNA